MSSAQSINLFDRNLKTLKQFKPNSSSAAVRAARRALDKLDDLNKQIPSLLQEDPDASSDLRQRYFELQTEFQKVGPNCRLEIEKAESILQGASTASNESPNDQADLQAQQQEAQELAEIEVISREASQIVDEMKEVQKLTVELNTKVQEDHDVIVKVDSAISQANEDMKNGNSDLQNAEDHQKKTCLVM